MGRLIQYCNDPMCTNFGKKMVFTDEYGHQCKGTKEVGTPQEVVERLWDEIGRLETRVKLLIREEIF